MSGELDDLLRHATRYRPAAVVRAERLGRSRAWTSGRGSRLVASSGDWLVTDGSEQWTVAADVFARTYERRPDGTYVKTGTVEAVRLARAVDVPTLEGTSAARAGDWLLRGEGGDVWPVADAYFRSHYTAG